VGDALVDDDVEAMLGSRGIRFGVAIADEDDDVLDVLQDAALDAVMHLGRSLPVLLARHHALRRALLVVVAVDAGYGCRDVGMTSLPMERSAGKRKKRFPDVCLQYPCRSDCWRCFFFKDKRLPTSK